MGSQLKILVEFADSKTISRLTIILIVLVVAGARRAQPFASSRFYLGDSNLSRHQKCELVQLSSCSLSEDLARRYLRKGSQLLYSRF